MQRAIPLCASVMLVAAALSDDTAAHHVHEVQVTARKPIPRSDELVVVDFIAPPPGRFEIACSEYCGNGHGRMKASLISVAAPATSRQDTR